MEKNNKFNQKFSKFIQDAKNFFKPKDNVEFIESLEEDIHFDTFLTIPFAYFANKPENFYFYSLTKITKLVPEKINMQNLLDPTPRKSVWITRDAYLYYLPILNYLKENFGDDFCKGFIPCFTKEKNQLGYYKSYLGISTEFYNNNKDKLEALSSFKYSKKLKYKDVGRGGGNEYPADEWTHDQEIIPESQKQFTFSDMIKNDYIQILKEEEFKAALDYYNSKSDWNQMVGRRKDWFKYSNEEYNNKRNNYEARHEIKNNLVEVVESKSNNYVYDGFLKVSKKKEKINGKEVEIETVHRPDAVCVLGFVNNKVAMIKQKRYAISETIYELPAGLVEDGEDIEVAAKREFEEEVGYKINELSYYGFIYASPGYSNEKIHLFMTNDVVKSKQKLDETEELEVCFIELEEALKLIENNKINDSKTVCLITKFLLS